MRDIEERAVRERARALDAEEITVGLQEIPDTFLIREIIRRYSFMVDLKDAYESVLPKVQKAHSMSDLEWI